MTPKIESSLFNRKWFDKQLERKGLSQRAMARLLGINQALVSQMFQGRRHLPLDEAIKWAETLEVPLEDVIFNAGMPISAKLAAYFDSKRTNSPTRAPLIGYIDENLVVHYSPPEEASWVQNPNGLKETVALRCRIPFGQAHALDGALLYYCELKERKIDPEIIGRLCIVRVRGRTETLLRTVRRGYETGLHNLGLFLGTPIDEGVQLEAAMPVHWIKL